MSAARKIARHMARTDPPGNGAAPPELVQLKAWHYEAAIQVQLWTQRAQQLHAAIVQREGQPELTVIAPAPPEPE